MKKDGVSLILIYNDSGEILFQDRKKISKHGEKYGFFGGHLEGEESPEQTLQREIKEELELETDEFEKLEFFKKFTFEIPERDVLGERFVFIAKYPRLDEIRINEGEKIITNFEDLLNLEISEREKIMLREIRDYLK